LPDEYFEYTTKAGDTFDILALDAYNDEAQAHIIIQANPDYCSTLVFSAGVILKIPFIDEAVPETLPPWKR
jgi:hypothetical protein